MGELALDRVQGQAGDHQRSRQVFGCGLHRVGLLFFPRKKQDLEQKEPELGAGSTQGMQLPDELVLAQIIPVEQLQP